MVIRDFRHIVALLKAINEIEYLEKLLDNSLKNVQETALDDSIVQLILDSTDRVFLPMLLNRKLASKLIEVEMQNDKDAIKKIVNNIEDTIKTVPKQEKKLQFKNKDEALRLAYTVCLLDDILGWYKINRWDGPAYHIKILETKYKARQLYLSGDIDSAKRVLNTLPKSEIEKENKCFYSKNWG